MEKLAREINAVKLPSSLWGIHIEPNFEFIGILHIKISQSKVSVDKGIILLDENNTLKAKILLNGFILPLPNIASDIKLIDDVSALVKTLQNMTSCMNSSEAEKFPECLKLIEDESGYCHNCKSESGLRVYEEDISYQCDEISLNVQDRSKELVIDYENADENKVIQEKNEPDDREIQNAEKQAVCNLCGKIISPAYCIEEHMLTHTQEKPFKCKTCKRGFTKRFNLKMHENTHSGIKPYICSMCGKSYTTSSNLKTHTLSCHSKQKKCVCDICGMKFLYPLHLKIHMRKHTGEKPYMCTICGKKFSKNIHLTIHTRTHTGEKPHDCNFCRKSFTTTGGLAYHRKNHHKNIAS